MKNGTCFSRDGTKIPYWKMAKLIASDHYRIILKDRFYWFSIKTTWFGFAVKYKNKNYIFQSEVCCIKCPVKNNVLDGEIYDTEDNAMLGHVTMVEKWFKWKLLIKHIWHSHILGTYEFKRQKITKGRLQKIWASFTR